MAATKLRRCMARPLFCAQAYRQSGLRGNRQGGLGGRAMARGGTASHGSAELSGPGKGSGRQSGRSAPQSQRCAEGLPVRLPPVS